MSSAKDYISLNDLYADGTASDSDEASSHTKHPGGSFEGITYSENRAEAPQGSSDNWKLGSSVSHRHIVEAVSTTAQLSGYPKKLCRDNNIAEVDDLVTGKPHSIPSLHISTYDTTSPSIPNQRDS